MATDAEQQFLFSGGDDGIVAKWDLNSEAEEGEAILQTDRGIYAIQVLSDWQLLFAGTSDGNIYVYDLATKSLRLTYRHTSAPVYGFFFDPIRQLLVSLHGKGHLGTLQLSSLKPEGVFWLSKENLRAAVPGPDGESWLLGGSDHRIHRWQSGQDLPGSSWKAHDNSVFALRMSPDGKHLLSGGRDAHLKVWEMADQPRLISSIPAHNFTINDIRFSPDGKIFATASRDKTIKLWKTEDWSLAKVLDAARHNGHQHSVNQLLWLSSDNSLLSCSDDRRVVRWQLTTEGL
jgi:WD40 repeat protein